MLWGQGPRTNRAIAAYGGCARAGLAMVVNSTTSSFWLLTWDKPGTVESAGAGRHAAKFSTAQVYIRYIEACTKVLVAQFLK